MYSILKGDKKNIKKAKGVKKCVVKKQIMHEQYKETLFDKKQLWHGMNILRSEGHEIYGMYVNKKSLSSLDSKFHGSHPTLCVYIDNSRFFHQIILPTRLDDT